MRKCGSGGEILTFSEGFLPKGAIQRIFSSQEMGVWIWTGQIEAYFN
jgi:hypothetical protein